MTKPYAELKSELDRQVRESDDFSLASLANENEWWMNALKNRTDHAGQPLDVHKLRRVELFWCYWMEEAGLVQTMNALCLRFQNKDGVGQNPLAHFDVAPLYPIAGLLWGYIEDEKNRISLKRRAFEYEHEYGLQLVGRAVSGMTPVDRRSRFLQVFHTVLNMTQRFYVQLDDLTVNEDARPLLSALKDLQLVLSDGSYNQFGQLPIQARVEMLLAQTILAQPELKEFFGARVMHSYREPWMPNVDAMRRIMRWGDVSIAEFDNLARAGELLVLTVRQGPFYPGQMSPTSARDWAITFRDQILQYIHSYRAVTGVDLSVTPASAREVDATQPSVYLAARERSHQQTAAR